jgi:alpha-1,2-mannosyltransferase
MAATIATAARSGAWLTARRIRIYAAVILLLYAAAAVYAVSAGVGQAGDPRAPVGADFASFWSASTLARNGQPLAVYDRAALARQETIALGRGDLFFAFAYPPTYLALLLPLAMLPFAWALVGWTVAGIGAYLAALRAIIPVRAAVLPALAFPGALITMLNGQNGLFAAACFGGALAWGEERPFGAGLLFGLIACKPHLALLIPVALLAGARWRTIVGAAASFFALTAASLVLFGPDLWIRFFGELANLGGAVSSANDTDLIAKMQSVFALAVNAGAPHAVALAAQLIVSLAAALYVAIVWRRGATAEVEAAVLVVSAIVAAPFVFDYDLTALGVAVAFLVRAGMARGFLSWERTALAVLWFAPAVVRLSSVGLHATVTPLLCLGFLLLIERRRRAEITAVPLRRPVV